MKKETSENQPSFQFRSPLLSLRTGGAFSRTERFFERHFLTDTGRTLFYRLEVCVPECHFPETEFFSKKSGKFPVPSIREHPLPGPASVPAFGTGFFPACFKPPNASRMKVSNFKFRRLSKTSTGTQTLIAGFSQFCNLSSSTRNF